MKRFLLGFLCALALAVVPACGGDDDGGSGADAAGGGDAEAFCTQYGTVCSFGGTGFADMAACVTAFEGWATTRQACVVEHVGLADAAEDGSADETMHCGHAAGAAPCN